MKHSVTRFKTAAVCLKEIAPFIRNGTHLHSGKPFKRLGGMRSREILANWLVCAVNNDGQAERLIFTSDPLGGDGVLYDTETQQAWPTEHVMARKPKDRETLDPQAMILAAIADKQNKGGSAYASGKTLIVFLEGAEASWYPNRVAKAMPKTDFSDVWVVALQRVADAEYEYGVTQLDVSDGNAPTWTIRIRSDFAAWDVIRLQ